MNLIDAAKQFATPETCNDFLESMRWPDGVECAKCGGKRVTKYVKLAGTRTRKHPKTGKLEEKPVPARILYVCTDCKKQFSVTEGTIFNDTHLPLEKWYMAAALMVNAKKGVSALQIKRDLGVAYKTAWYLSHRIRKAMELIERADEEPLTGTVEADETYMGSKKYESAASAPSTTRSRYSASWSAAAEPRPGTLPNPSTATASSANSRTAFRSTPTRSTRMRANCTSGFLRTSKSTK